MKIIITKKYGEKVLFDKQEFVFGEGKITCVLGESGVGKTTLLRAICGLENYEGETDAPQAISVAFQEPRLLPFATAIENLTFVGIEKEEGKKWLSWAEIEEENQLAGTLSGGEKQRVSLVRALAKGGDLLLLDEPFSSVDTSRKVRLLAKLREVLKAENRTTIFVTHDVDEAAFVADEILLIKEGRLASFSVQERANYGSSALREEIFKILMQKD